MASNMSSALTLHRLGFDSYSDREDPINYSSARIAAARLTCRFWRNSIDGCHDTRCPYSHHRTGYVSPELPYTCWFWRHGGCAYSSIDCIYAHYYAKNDQREPDLYTYFGDRLSHREATIAQAAVEAGFNISNWDALLRLLSAVNDAHRSDNVLVLDRGHAGDFYDGAAYDTVYRVWLATTPYPDRYIPSADSRVRRKAISSALGINKSSRQSSHKASAPVSFENRNEQYYHGRASTVMSEAPKHSNLRSEPVSKHTPDAKYGFLSPVFEERAAAITSDPVSEPGDPFHLSSSKPITQTGGTGLPTRALLRHLEDSNYRSRSPSPTASAPKGKAKAHGPNGPNAIPLGPRILLKRKELDDDDVAMGNTEHPSTLADGVKRIRLEPSSTQPSKSPTKARAKLSARAKRRQQAAAARPSDVQGIATRAVVQKVLGQIEQAKGLLVGSCDALGERWEQDVAFRADAVVEQLTALNGHMQTVVEALGKAKEAVRKLV